VATKLGDLLDDIVVVGGLVPTLLIDQDHLPQGAERHVGTLDLDVGLSLAILDDHRYEEIVARLKRAGFSPDKNEAGNPTRQRWRVAVGATAHVTVDFLIPPSATTDKGGTLRDLDKDLAAVITPGLGLASRDREKVTLKGTTITGETAERNLWVCGPGAFVVLKALAFDGRGENKDAYDLFYVIRNFGTGVDSLSDRLRPLLDDVEATKAVAILRRDFSGSNAVGPRRVAEFITGGLDATIQADAAGFVQALLRGIGAV
jgi:hypothetical protein